jgi:uncharacterized protein (TIGR02217 family)
MAFARRRRDCRDVFLWAYPQIVRDGLTHFDLEDDVTDVHEVRFPLSLGLRAQGGPVFSTSITETASGHEHRNINWAQARRRYDAVPGIRSESDLAQLLTFFEARRGRGHGFLYEDPLDHASAQHGEAITATDQLLGLGDGVRSQFAVIKAYGEMARRITRPRADTLLVAVNGVAQASGWSLADKGVISFASPPAVGATVTAGFLFDVPVRFEQDGLELSLASFHAGDIGSVPLVELREG